MSKKRKRVLVSKGRKPKIQKLESQKLKEEFIDAAGETPELELVRKIYYSFESPAELLKSFNYMAFTEAASYVNGNFEIIRPIINQLLEWAKKHGITSDMLASNDYLAFVCCNNMSVREALWDSASKEQKPQMLQAWKYSAFHEAGSIKEFEQLLNWSIKLGMAGEILENVNFKEIIGHITACNLSKNTPSESGSEDTVYTTIGNQIDIINEA